ncbi:hypothetical protein HJC23_006956 [Cyclotella cryptica]|uniref:TauD/TfdA-like domain-containing protein n=1 Tax=Cyclotella cryptica TaxID=29204 RepID=A0ABD3QN31_9STRA|eukprot:CCRYP_004273-RA/>CCRYP_004273-RA protein AED:0.00 eAED:0.00 QI:114/-1/1/1/-1/1/1/1493/637
MNTDDTTDAACWNAFGSDSESDDEHTPPPAGDAVVSVAEHDIETVADAVSLAVTQHFAQLIKSSGISLKERVVAMSRDRNSEWEGLIREKLAGRGIHAVTVAARDDSSFMCDAAVIFHGSSESCDNHDDAVSFASTIRRSLLPGGMLWTISFQESNPIAHLSDYVWDVESAVNKQITPCFKVSRVQKRACVINSWSCPWMEKHSLIPEQVANCNTIGLPVNTHHETYLQYEQRVASDLTICPSVAERTREKVFVTGRDEPVYATVLTKSHVDRAVSILQKHGLVIIKGLLPPEQTLPWGEAVLEDFQDAVDRLKSHPVRPVDLLNPHLAHDNGDEEKEKAERVFEPLSYKEMAMREDLRVDLRSGPAMKKVAHSFAIQGSMLENKRASLLQNERNGPFTVDSDIEGTVLNWRFHPSIISILKALFNPKDANLSKGNFGRWNFGGSGPDGSPQPFRIGPIGSVISCPGAGDQAIHADTPHLFEHLDCLPCHYCNVFTPGYILCNEQGVDYFKNDFDNDGVWTGNSTIGGTALVDGSHKLSVTAKLLSEEDDVRNGTSNAESTTRRQLLQLHTIRPALNIGDVLIFDNRTLHYGLANTSEGDTTGVNFNAGRRPMLYLNVTQSWFHDPKNWDDRESIFS